MSRNNNKNNSINFNTLNTHFTKPSYKFYPENEDDNHINLIVEKFTDHPRPTP